MKISIIGPVFPYRGGIAHFTTFMTRELVSEGHEVQVCSFKRQYPGWLYPGSSDKDPSQDPIRVDARFLLDPIYPWTWESTVRAVDAFAPDLVVFQWWTTFWAPAYAYMSRRFSRKGLRVVYLVHNLIPHEARWFDASLARLALTPAEAFIVQTPKEQSRLLDLLPGSPVEVCQHPIYSAFAGQPADQSADKSAARKKLGLSTDTPVILFFGIVRPYKGLVYLIQAVRLLKDRGTDTQLLVAGEFWESEGKYRDLIKQLGLESRVVVSNRYIPNEEIPPLFCAADLFAAPYVEGTQSGAIKLAYGFGLPVISTTVLQEASGPGNQPHATRLVPPRDSAALADAIQAWIENPSPEKPSIPMEDGWQAIARNLEQIALRNRPGSL
jgi:glycosyltransferase involved in cell wall biosynthesis